MSLGDAVRSVVAAALRSELPAVLAELGGRPRLLSIRELPVGFRTVLEAEKAGEITVYRRGKYSAVDEADFIAWMKRAPRPTADAPVDAVGELLELDRERRAKRKGRAA